MFLSGWDNLLPQLEQAAVFSHSSNPNPIRPAKSALTPSPHLLHDRRPFRAAQTSLTRSGAGEGGGRGGRPRGPGAVLGNPERSADQSPAPGPGQLGVLPPPPPLHRSPCILPIPGGGQRSAVGTRPRPATGRSASRARRSGAPPL